MQKVPFVLWFFFFFRNMLRLPERYKRCLVELFLSLSLRISHTLSLCAFLSLGNNGGNPFRRAICVGPRGDDTTPSQLWG
ncbi:hypothetical protein LZ31DRAFT_132299 [Colletotrichum somersetense]|nr:hypothetical protein LZ31DRAFT_132299 [Colletotrichum somersetense]